MTAQLAAAWSTRYPAEHADPYCVSPDEARRLLTPSRWNRIVALGDSVAAGVREPTAGYEDLGGFDRVARALDRSPDHCYLNLGERGRKTREVVDTQRAAAIGFDADLALIATGGNDALSRAFDPGQVAGDLARLIAALRRRGTDVAVIGMFDLARSGLLPAPVSEAMAPRFDQLDEVTRRAAAAEGAVFVDNHRHPMARKPQIFASDLMHCNARGHAISAATLTAALAGSIRSD